MKLRYVFSAPSMLRLCPSKWVDENPDKQRDLANIIKRSVSYTRQVVEDNAKGEYTFDIDILFNAFTEKNFGAHIQSYDNFGFSKIYADSGGLQMVTQNKAVTAERRKDIYQVQSGVDYAMCFDDIPCKTFEHLENIASRSDVSNKIFYTSQKEEKALATAQNIKEQIIELDSLKSSAKIFYIIQGNTATDMIEWFDKGVEIIDKDKLKKYLAGLAVADTCMGNGELETIDMMIAYKSIYEKYKDIIPPYLHLLGVGALNRLLPVIYLSQKGFLSKDIVISFDSSSFSMSFFMGKFEGKSKGSEGIREFFKGLVSFYAPIFKEYDPSFEEGAYVSLFSENSRNLKGLLAACEERKLNEIIARSIPTLTGIFRLINFTEQLNKILQQKTSDKSAIGLLQEVSTFEDMISWKSSYQKMIESKRIKRESPKLCDLF